MRRLALLPLLTISIAVLAQDAPQHFHFQIKNARVDGTDEYVITRTADGFHVSGNAKLNSPGRELLMTHSEDLDTSWMLKEYRFTTKVGAEVQNVNALRKGDTVTLTLDAKGQLVPKDIPWKPNTIVLDNFILAHYQVLLNALAAQNPTASTEWQVIVPQRMSFTTAKLQAKPDAGTGTLDGKSITTQTFSLEIGSTLIEITADSNNRLMRMQVPLQQFDALRDGFVPPQKNPARSPPPASTLRLISTAAP